MQFAGDGMLFSVCRSVGYQVPANLDRYKYFACMVGNDTFAMVVDPSGVNGLTCMHFRCNSGDVAGRAGCSHPDYPVTYGGVEGPPHIFFRHHAISYG